MHMLLRVLCVLRVLRVLRFLRGTLTPPSPPSFRPLGVCSITRPCVRSIHRETLTVTVQTTLGDASPQSATTATRNPQRPRRRHAGQALLTTDWRAGQNQPASVSWTLGAPVRKSDGRIDAMDACYMQLSENS